MGSVDYNASIDMWSAGCILAELASGRYAGGDVIRPDIVVRGGMSLGLTLKENRPGKIKEGFPRKGTTRIVFADSQ